MDVCFNVHSLQPINLCSLFKIIFHIICHGLHVFRPFRLILFHYSKRPTHSCVHHLGEPAARRVLCTLYHLCFIPYKTVQCYRAQIFLIPSVRHRKPPTRATPRHTDDTQTAQIRQFRSSIISILISPPHHVSDRSIHRAIARFGGYSLNGDPIDRGECLILG